MSDEAEYVEITAQVKRKDAEYLAKWAGARGCDVKDVAGESVGQFLEDWFDGHTEIRNGSKDTVPNEDLRELLDRMRTEADYRGGYEGGGVLSEFADQLEELIDGE